MTTHTQADPTPHVDQGPDKVDDTHRIARAKEAVAKGTQNPRYQSDPVYKGAIDNLGALGTGLESAVTDVVQKDAAAHNARTVRNKTRVAYDKGYGVAVAAVEQGAVSKDDIEKSGFVYLDPSNPGLVLPTGIDAKQDLKLGLVRVHVHYASGRRPCIVEISNEPANPASWQRIDGNGVTRKLTGLAAGTWYARAATTRAHQQSTWFGPIAFTVK
jgi:hypothetical protein